MKKTLFAIASLAVLAVSCVKEQQPSNPADSAVVTSLKVSVADTKVTVNEVTGACTWQEGDQVAVWYDDPNSEDAKVGQKVIFTYKGLFEDGSAEFTTTESVTDGYVAAKVGHPVGSITDAGSFGLVREYIYDANRTPVYLRSEEVVTNPDGSISAQLMHNASVFKFTLHDIPAYAAGFVLETVKYAAAEDGFVDKDGNKIDIENQTGVFAITTKFPYKTGYTADPSDNSNDITLYSVAAHSSYLSRVYLIDGNGDEIEGSERKFKQSWNNISKDDFIELPRIEFKKADLRKDYIMIKGVKWAKGNLRYNQNVTSAGFQTGWSLVANQWDYVGYNGTSSVVGGTTYTYDESAATEYRINRTNESFEHFNFGGIGKWSFDITNFAQPTAAMEISGKIYSDNTLTTEVTGDARFASEGTSAPALYGDLAFWASKGEYRMPTTADMTSIHNQASKIPGWCVVDGMKVWGCLFRNPELGYDRSTDATAHQNKEFSMADLETGMFFPYGGRTAETNPDIVINQRKQMAYRAATYVQQNKAKTKWYATYYSNSPALKMHNSWNADNSAWSAAAGFMIRPVLVD